MKARAARGELDENNDDDDDDDDKEINERS